MSYLSCIGLMDKIGRRILLLVLLLIAGVGLLASVTANQLAGSNQSMLFALTFDMLKVIKN